MRTFVISAALLAVAACSQETQDATPDTTAEVETTAPTMPPAAPSMTATTETTARSLIEAAGYTNVTGLTQSADGSWTATATRDGETTSVVVDGSGVRVASTTTP